MGGSGWRVVGVSYVDELVDRNMAEMLQLSCVLGALVLACALLTSWVLSRLLTRPLRGLAGAMESFEADADHFTYHPGGRHAGGAGTFGLLRPYGAAPSSS